MKAIVSSSSKSLMKVALAGIVLLSVWACAQEPAEQPREATTGQQPMTPPENPNPDCFTVIQVTSPAPHDMNLGTEFCIRFSETGDVLIPPTGADWQNVTGGSELPLAKISQSPAVTIYRFDAYILNADHTPRTPHIDNLLVYEPYFGPWQATVHLSPHVPDGQPPISGGSAQGKR